MKMRGEENDELRKVQVQEAEIHPRTVAHLCITHLLSFFTLSFRQDCPDGRGDDDEHAGVHFRWPIQRNQGVSSPCDTGVEKTCVRNEPIKSDIYCTIFVLQSASLTLNIIPTMS